jgi:hypothetical protein
MNDWNDLELARCDACFWKGVAVGAVVAIVIGIAVLFSA